MPPFGKSSIRSSKYDSVITGHPLEVLYGAPLGSPVSSIRMSDGASQPLSRSSRWTKEGPRFTRDNSTRIVKKGTTVRSGNGSRGQSARATDGADRADTKFRSKSHAKLEQHIDAVNHDTMKSNDNVYGEGFVNALKDELEQEAVNQDSFWSRLRISLAYTILTHRFEMCVGLVIMTNFAVIACETDARARRDSSLPASREYDIADTTIDVISVLNVVYLLIYAGECAVRMYVLRWKYFSHMWNVFDFSIVIIGIFDEILAQSEFDAPTGLRTLRCIRMLRASRVLVSFDELYALVSGLSNAVKTLMWAGILMLMVLTMWSVMAVEFVKPLMSEIASQNGFGTCTWCPTAFDNIPIANLTFFQMISGDGWGHLARPLIEEYPWTALLFLAVIFSMMFGLLNLVVAVIVDSAAQAREADVLNMAAKKDKVRAAAWDCFNEMLDALDDDGDGLISLDELRDGLVNEHDLAAYLTYMGIEEHDLGMVFELLDPDGTGAIAHEDFAQQLYQMKTQEIPITMCYIRSGVAKLHQELEQISKQIQIKFDEMIPPHAKGPGNLHEVPGMPGIAKMEPVVHTTNEACNKKRATGLAHGKDERKEMRGSLFTARGRPTIHGAIPANCKKQSVQQTGQKSDSTAKLLQELDSHKHNDKPSHAENFSPVLRGRLQEEPQEESGDSAVRDVPASNIEPSPPGTVCLLPGSMLGNRPGDPSIIE